MFKLTGTNITMIRGDTGLLKLSPTWDGKAMEDGSYTAILSVKNSIDDDSYIFQKTADEKGQFYFQPEDTGALDPGTYIYDIQVSALGQVATIGPAKFKVVGDVTQNGND